MRRSTLISPMKSVIMAASTVAAGLIRSPQWSRSSSPLTRNPDRPTALPVERLRPASGGRRWSVRGQDRGVASINVDQRIDIAMMVHFDHAADEDAMGSVRHRNLVLADDAGLCAGEHRYALGAFDPFAQCKSLFTFESAAAGT